MERLGFNSISLITKASRFAALPSFSPIRRGRDGRREAYELRATASGKLPQTPEEVMRWARSAFAAEVSPSRPDCSINLAKACLLVALEEEAAAAVWDQQREREEAAAQAAAQQLEALLLGGDNGAWDYLQDVQPPTACTRVMGSASTWSLARLDAVAEEVRSLLMSSGSSSAGVQQQQQQPPGGFQKPSSSRRSSSSGSMGGGKGNQAGLQKPSRGSGRGSGNRGSVVGGDGGRQEEDGAMPSSPMQLVSAVNTVLFDRHGYRRMERHGDHRNACWSWFLEDGRGSPAALTILYLEICSRLGLDLHCAPLEGGSYFVCWPSGEWALSAAGEEFVIDPYGAGDLLHIQEVAELFGLEMEPLQEQGEATANEAAVNDPVAWPSPTLPPSTSGATTAQSSPAPGAAPSAPASANGSDNTADPAAASGSRDSSGGMPAAAAGSEVGSSASARGSSAASVGLAPATRREVLCSLLADLQHARWCAAVGCPAEPALALALDVRAATWGAQAVGRALAGLDIERAVAAAERRLMLRPAAQNEEAQLQYGLLLFFAGRVEDAYLELAYLVEQRQRKQQQEGGDGSSCDGGSASGTERAAGQQHRASGQGRWRRQQQQEEEERAELLLLLEKVRLICEAQQMAPADSW